METVSAQDVTLSGTVMLYRKAELLSREAHGNLGVNPAKTRFGFAAESHVCPLTVPEFGSAALCYPIIFVGDDKQPVVAMGLRDGQNLYVNETGFEVDAYIPAYIRRYPFVLAGGAGEDRMMVCIDRAYEYISENAQFPFFENGEPTEYTKNSIQFCNDFETQNRMTAQFVTLLKELDLFEARSTTYTPTNPDGTQGEPQVIAQYFGVSDTRLNALPADKLVALRDSGALQQIYAHLTSLMNWERLLIRASIRENSQPQAANAS